MQGRAAQRSAAQHSAAQHSTAQCSTVQYSTVQYTVPEALHSVSHQHPAQSCKRVVLLTTHNITKLLNSHVQWMIITKIATVSLADPKIRMQEPQAFLHGKNKGKKHSFCFSTCQSVIFHCVLPCWMLSQLPCTATASVVFSLLMRRLHSEGRFVNVLRSPNISTAQRLHSHNPGHALSPCMSSCLCSHDLDPTSQRRALNLFSEETNMGSGLDQI